MGVLKFVLLFAFPLLVRAESTPSLALDLAPSTATNLGGRNIFHNPAATGFEADLNDGRLLGAIVFSDQANLQRASALGLSYGRMVLGFEDIPLTDGRLSRFSYGIGLALSRHLYLGTRHRLYRGSSPTLSGFNTLDLGLQFRPAPWLSLGGVTTAMDHTSSGPTRGFEPRNSLGINVRPFDFGDLIVEFREGVDGLWRAAPKVLFRPLLGLQLEAGYNGGVHVGLQLSVNSATIFSQLESASEGRRSVMGIELAASPKIDSYQTQSTLKLTIDSSLTEAGTPESLFRRGRPSHLELLRALSIAKKTSGLRTVDLRIETFPLGLSSALEIHDALIELRKSGIEVNASLSQAGVREYLIASAANRIAMEPAGELRLAGLSAQRYYLKGTLDKIGIEGEFLARGDYKSAPELFTRREGSPASRRASLEELRRAEATIVDRLSKTGRLDRKKWGLLLTKGLFSSAGAKAEGLIDQVESVRDDEDLFARRSVRVRSTRLSLPPEIAVIPLTGDILSDGMDGSSLFASQAITPERTKSLLAAANSSPGVSVILLRISSPGGEVLASHRIAELIQQSKKPVYISMGDVAASGGYLISAPGRRIFASELTSTGSIGVFLGKPNFAELYKKLDLHKEILSDSPTSGLYSEHRPWSPEERAIMLARLNQYYEDFTRYVSEKRSLSGTEVEAAAQGRVWLGSAAKELKLIDNLGGFSDALNQIGKDEELGEFAVSILRLSPSLVDFFTPPSPLNGTSQILKDFGLYGAAATLRWNQSLLKNPALYWDPSEIQ